MRIHIARLYGVLKLRIGFAIMLCTLAGIAAASGQAPSAWAVTLLALAVLMSSASAGAFNQLVEADLDARMARTQHRPFVTGDFKAGPVWHGAVAVMLVVAVATAALATNGWAAGYVFLGAFVYGVVYTVWLKRRSVWNIVVGGLAGSFAVLAGAAAVDPNLGVAPVVLAIVLFLWTPPHFWSLASYLRDDYAAAGVPMLPVVAGMPVTAWVTLGHTLALVGLSIIPFWYGMGWLYLAGAISGGCLFLYTSIRFVRDPVASAAMVNFRASLVQLSLLLVGTLADRLVLG